MCVGEIVQQTVLIGNVVQIDILSIQLTDSIAVSIYDSCIIKELLSAFRIIGIGVGQFVITIA